MKPIQLPSTNVDAPNGQRCSPPTPNTGGSHTAPLSPRSMEDEAAMMLHPPTADKHFSKSKGSMNANTHDLRDVVTANRVVNKWQGQDDARKIIEARRATAWTGDAQLQPVAPPVRAMGNRFGALVSNANHLGNGRHAVGQSGTSSAKDAAQVGTAAAAELRQYNQVAYGPQPPAAAMQVVPMDEDDHTASPVAMPNHHTWQQAGLSRLQPQQLITTQYTAGPTWQQTSAHAAFPVAMQVACKSAAAAGRQNRDAWRCGHNCLIVARQADNGHLGIHVGGHGSTGSYAEVLCDRVFELLTSNNDLRSSPDFPKNVVVEAHRQVTQANASSARTVHVSIFFGKTWQASVCVSIVK